MSQTCRCLIDGIQTLFAGQVRDCCKLAIRAQDEPYQHEGPFNPDAFRTPLRLLDRGVGALAACIRMTTRLLMGRTPDADADIGPYNLAPNMKEAWNRWDTRSRYVDPEDSEWPWRVQPL
jgi:hypothetical protein